MFQILNGPVPYIPHAWKEEDALRGQPGRRGGRDPTRTPAPEKSTVRPRGPPCAQSFEGINNCIIPPCPPHGPQIPAALVYI